MTSDNRIVVRNDKHRDSSRGISFVNTNIIGMEAALALPYAAFSAYAPFGAYGLK